MYCDSCCSSVGIWARMLSTWAAAFSTSRPFCTAVLLSLLRDLEDVAINLQIVIGDPDLGLNTAQLDVVARQFSEARNQRVAALILGLIDLRVGRLDLPADLAPQVEFPGSVEPDIVIVDRAEPGCCRRKVRAGRRAG